MQAAGNTLTLPQHFRNILVESGYKGFYRAVGATMFRAGILTSTQLGTYDHAKQLIQQRTGKEGLAEHAAASAMAGFACSAASAPVDVIKVRIMKDSTYNSGLVCAADILKKEGRELRIGSRLKSIADDGYAAMAFYKGFFCCFLRLFPHTVLSLLLFEKFRALAGASICPLFEVFRA